jgi:hypothetical protein
MRHISGEAQVGASRHMDSNGTPVPKFMVMTPCLIRPLGRTGDAGCVCSNY